MLSRRHVLQAGVAAALLPARAAAAAPVDESGFVRIGGIDQWIAIQGRNASNPVILYLHGGPSEAQSPFLKEFLPWEQDFTVVNWDQRGSGKTYGRNGASTPGMTLDRLVDDTLEVAEHVRTRLAVRKVILVGQSWGSFLGVNAVKRGPELFHAFVGTGQVVSFASVVAGHVRWARAEATAVNDQATLKALDNAAALPEPKRDLALVGAAHKYVMPPADTAYAKMIDDFMGPKPYPAKGDVADWIAGNAFTEPRLLPVVMAADLRALGLDMKLPFFVIQGRDDHLAPFDAVKAYLDDIRAPRKAFVAIDGGHYACFTDAAAFVAALNKYVRPLAG
ncbi:MAG TPA: alpha/beta hydrolase [Rhizomicrobium sp.]|nr:alpha/beta hydrolase [Rhizomicrobium sp.]